MNVCFRPISFSANRRKYVSFQLKIFNKTYVLLLWCTDICAADISATALLSKLLRTCKLCHDITYTAVVTPLHVSAKAFMSYECNTNAKAAVSPYVFLFVFGAHFLQSILPSVFSLAKVRNNYFLCSNNGQILFIEFNE